MKLLQNYYTYNQISETFGISKSALTHRVNKLKIKGRVLGNDATVYFTESQAKKLIAYLTIKCENHPRKISVIELYQRGKTGRLIAVVLGISVKLSYDCIREYNQTGCVTVESKINNMLI